MEDNKLKQATNLLSPDGEDVSPQLKKQMDSYIISLMHVIHNQQTSKSVVETLRSAPPEESIPATAIQLNSMVEPTFQKKFGKIDDSVKIAGALYAVSDLVELGNVSGSFQQEVSKDQVVPLFQKTVSKYVHMGLADGSIDPIKLQMDAEPLLNDKQKQIGSTIQKELGLPDQPTLSMGIDTITKSKTKPLEQENQKLRSLIEQQKAQQVQGGNSNGV